MPPTYAYMKLALVLLSICFFVSTEANVDQNKEKETLAIKNKLATAEGRVSDLISRLDTVSNDASRAKSEIHNTLMEVWKVVDLLGRDQCGDVVDKVRVAQKSAESKVASLQDENRRQLKDIEHLKLHVAKKDDSLTSLQTELKAERARREGLEGEARELRDKLHWANIMSNESKTYELVAERLQNLLVVVSERTQLLNRISTMFNDAHQGSDEWQKEIQALTELVRDSERDFASGYQGAAVDGFKRQMKELETRLRNAEVTRDEMRVQRDDARSKLGKFDDKSARRTLSQSAGFREPVVRRGERENSWFGWLTFGVVSCGTGVVAATLLSLWTNRTDNPDNPIGADEQTTFGFTPTSARADSRTPPATGAPSMSPLTYVNQGSASRTPGSKNSTPRRY